MSRRFQQRSGAFPIESIARIESNLNQIVDIVVLVRIPVNIAVANCDGVISWERARTKSTVQNWTLFLLVLQASNVIGIVVVL